MMHVWLNEIKFGFWSNMCKELNDTDWFSWFVRFKKQNWMIIFAIAAAGVYVCVCRMKCKSIQFIHKSRLVLHHEFHRRIVLCFRLDFENAFMENIKMNTAFHAASNCIQIKHEAYQNRFVCKSHLLSEMMEQKRTKPQIVAA